MSRVTVYIGDFLKNAGIVGFKYLLDVSTAEKDKVYGITDDGQGMWIDREFLMTADLTDMYFKAFIKRYGALTAYHITLDKINRILEAAEDEKRNSVDYKEDLKYINEKLLSNSYQSGFANIRHYINNPEVYEQLKNNKLKENMDKKILCERLEQLQVFLKQPMCEETFSMKSIIYNYINRFWDGKSFLLRTKAHKDMREMFDEDFTEPLRQYVTSDHEKSRDMCIECSEKIDTKEKISIAFMKDQADDLTRKRSAFWNCKVDAYLCPLCAFIYSLVPLGFTLIGRNFVFINMNRSIDELLSANSSYNRLAMDSERDDNEKYASWIARTIDLLLQEKSRELGNIQVIARGIGESDRYTFDVISKDILQFLNDEKVRENLDRLSEHPYVKVGKEYYNIHENVILNILRYHSQYHVLSKLLRAAMENKGALVNAVFVYDIQIRMNLLRKVGGYKNGGDKMNRYAVRENGYELRCTLLMAKGTSDDACIRGTVYKLLNALSVGNVEHFMEILMRIYCSTKLQVPNAFIEFFKDRDTFAEFGYAFLLGLQGSHYEKKEEKKND